MALAWMVAIARMIESRRWSPVRPAMMVVVITGCLLLMGQTLIDYAETGTLRSTFYLAAWNLGMALFDCKMALILARRQGFTAERRQRFAGFSRRMEAEEGLRLQSVVIPPVAKTAPSATSENVASRPKHPYVASASSQAA
ncbi:MAG: hypothetical protein AAF577_09480 [Pseudomonadota bacterium]